MTTHRMKLVPLITTLAILVLSVGAVAETVTFTDDFSNAAAKWRVLWAPDNAIHQGDGHLVFGHLEQEARMRIEEIITNDFDLTIEIDLGEMPRTRWFGIRFGTTTTSNMFHNGHIIYIRDNGEILLLREVVPGEPKQDATHLFTLGKLPPFSGKTTILLRVRPNIMQLVFNDQHVLVFPDIQVLPGNVELVAMHTGPMKLYSVELVAQVE